MAERTCARCPNTFDVAEGAKGTKSCWCPDCRRSYMREYMRTYQDPQATPCPGCGERMTRKSRTCAACRRAALPVWSRTHRPCLFCEKLFWPSTDNHRCCSASCGNRLAGRVRYRREAERQRALAPPMTGDCQWCWQPVVGFDTGGLRRFCSTACSSARNAHWTQWKATDRCHLPYCYDCGMVGGFNPMAQRRRCEPCQTRFDERRRNASQARRQRVERNGDATIHWTTVGERDAWVCHLCNKKVPKRPGNAADMDGATVDHLLPISRDGEHTWSNVALAHRSCNLSRGAGGETQLRLVG